MKEEPIMGIYVILNKVSHGAYVGKSVNIKARWHHHRSDLKTGKHVNPHLLSSYQKYGEESFEYHIATVVLNEGELAEREKEIFELYKNQGKKMYNLKEVGDGVNRLSIETRLKMSIAQRGIKKNTGPLSPLQIEVLQRMAEGNKGRSPTEETRKKIGAANKGKQRGGHRIPHTEEAKQRMSAAQKGRPKTEEQKRKMKEGWARRKENV